MDNEWIKPALGFPIAVIAFLVGGFDIMLAGLLAIILIDFITGILKAIHNKSLSSEIMFRGGIKKIGILLVVAAANIIDNALGFSVALRGVTMGYYIANEGLSILENWAHLGLPLPEKVVNILKQLQSKGDLSDTL